MDHFQYHNGQLHAEDVALADIAKAVGTPVYVYSTATLEHHYNVFEDALSGLDHLTCYAVKANSNMAVLRTLAQLGSGADVVSGGELQRALAAGIPPERIVFSGVGKTAEEITSALAAGIYQFNVESVPELECLSARAVAMGLTAPVAFRINPDVDAQTHAKISTGQAGNKFGIAWGEARAVYAHAASLPGLRIVGVDVHIGSQLTALQPFRAAFDRVAGLVGVLRADGHDITRVDLGGGLGIPYDPDLPPPPLPRDYGLMVKEVTASLGCQIITEPGRLITGNAGVLLSRVIYVKDGEARRFVILDAAMNDLLRPAIYDAFHSVVPVFEPSADAPIKPVDFVGPVCETGDTFASSRPSTPLHAGDLVVLRSAGAYGAVMASSYNTRPLVPEVLVKGCEYAVVRPRIEVEELIAMDRLPPWLDDAKTDANLPMAET